MSRRGTVILGLALLPALALAADQWEFEGVFVAVKPGQPATAIFRLADGSTVEIPVAALGAASRREATRLASAGSAAFPTNSPDTGVTIRGPSGKAVSLPVPTTLRDIETKAYLSRTAEEAKDEYRKFLDRGDLRAEDRQAAETRLSHWQSLVEEGRVRLGDDWITRDECRDRQKRAADMVDHAIELLRLGNGGLAREELRDASRLDPESGKADFLMGLVYVLVAGNDAKGIEHFEQVVRREPKNTYALNNLAVCEVTNKQSNQALGHFRQALEIMPNAQAVADNLGAMIRAAGAGKSRISSKVLAECNTLYRKALFENGLQPLSSDRAEGFTLLGEDGTVWDRATASALIRPAGAVEGAGAQPQAGVPPAASIDSAVPGPPSPERGQPIGGIDFQALIQAAQAALQQPVPPPSGP